MNKTRAYKVTIFFLIEKLQKPVSTFLQKPRNTKRHYDLVKILFDVIGGEYSFNTLRAMRHGNTKYATRMYTGRYTKGGTRD